VLASLRVAGISETTNAHLTVEVRSWVAVDQSDSSVLALRATPMPAPAQSWDLAFFTGLK